MTSDELNTRFGRNLRYYREKQQLTQEQVAELTGISSTSYKAMERGKTGTKFKTLVKIAEILDVDPSVLLIEDEKDAALTNINAILHNKPKSFIMAVEDIFQNLITIYEQRSN